MTLPALGESVTEGTVTRWLKKVGDEVAVDEPLLEVSTDKVDTEIPSPVAGTLLEIKVEEDETVEVGAELAIVGSGDAGGDSGSDDSDDSGDEPSRAGARAGGEGRGARARARAEADEPEPEEKAEPEAAAGGTEVRGRSRTPRPTAASRPATSPPWSARWRPSTTSTWPASPAPASVAGSASRTCSTRPRRRSSRQAPAEAPAAAAAAPAASGGAAPAASAPSPLRGTTEKMSRLRKIIAQRMRESLQGSAQLTQVMEVDVTSVARLRDSVKADFLAREGVKLTYLPFFAKAAIDTLKQHPKLNAAIDEDKGEVTYFDRENVAFAVDTEKGLLTPVVKDAGDLSIAGLAKKIADVAERTRTNKIGPDELSGGTFTITNLGSFGALFDTPIINKPQVAILGPGAVVKRPVVIDDANLGETIAVRHMVYLSLTYDHRLVDGADAGRFLADVKKRLESGQFEV